MAISNLRVIGIGGGLSFYVGDFTASVGATSQTLGVGAGQILMVSVTPNLTSEPIDLNVKASWSTSGNVTTITIYTLAAITAGSICVLLSNGG